MTETPLVTIVCATRNARDAVTLTLESFRSYTSEPCVVLVGDNGSVDGTLKYLQNLPWVTVIDMAARVDSLRRAHSALQQRLATTSGLSRRERRWLLASAAQVVDEGELTDHGETLDWLAAHVRTPFFLTLDSDVEFLQAGWLGEMLRRMDASGLSALGPYEPAIGSYRPRLAPHTLLLRTAAFHRLRTSFGSVVRFADLADLARWNRRPNTHDLDVEELADYPSGEFYPTAALLFERLCRAGHPWEPMPTEVEHRLRHLGHMSWAGEPSMVRSAALGRDHLAQARYAEAGAAWYRARGGSGRSPSAAL